MSVTPSAEQPTRGMLARSPLFSAALVLCAFTAVAVVVAAWFPSSERASALEALTHKAENQARLIAYTIAPAVEFDDAIIVGEAFRGAARDVDFVGVIAVDGGGREVAQSGEVDREIAAGDTSERIVVETPIELQEGPPGSLRLVMSTSRIDRISREQLAIASGISLTVVLLGVLVSLGVARSIRRMELLLEENARARAAAEQASEVKSRFLANMSHEMRTPLNGVLGLSDVLLRRRLDERARGQVRSIARSGRTLLTLVNDILDLSRVESGRIELESVSFDPEAASLAVCDMFVPACHDRSIALSLEVEREVPSAVLGDRLRFEQVLTNLVGNAVKFTARGAVKVALAWDESASTLRAAVHDSGIGIPESKLEVIFDAFQQADTSTTRRFGGSGLGLAISRQLARRMGGELVVTSSEGAGSVFSFTMPVTREGAAPALRLEDAPPVWIVSGSDDVRAALHRAAEQAGARVEEVAVDALGARIDALAESERPPIVIWDARLAEPGAALRASIAHAVRQARLICVAHVPTVAEPPLAGIPVRVLPAPFSRDAVVRALRGDDLVVAPASERDDPSGPTLSARILIAEDDETNRLVVSSFLEEIGVRADVVVDGAQAVERACGESRYDIILMDCQMPVLDGYEATRRIRKWEAEHQRARSPIIAVTAHALAEERARAVSAGMDGYLTKPLTLESFRATLVEHVGRTSAPNADPLAQIAPVAAHEELSIERMKTAPDVIAKIASSFVASSDRALAAIADAIARGAWHEAKRDAHTLKGSCLTLGAHQVASIAAELEASLEARDATRASELVLGLEMGVLDLQTRLRELSHAA